MLCKLMRPWSLHSASTTGGAIRTARWLWATALILSAPAAAIEPDVTGSIPQPRPFADAEVGRSPRFRSIASIHAKLTELGLLSGSGAGRHSHKRRPRKAEGLLMIVLLTDFRLHGPYTGQMKAVLHNRTRRTRDRPLRGNIGVRQRTISSGAFLREATRVLIQIVAL